MEANNRISIYISPPGTDSWQVRAFYRRIEKGEVIPKDFEVTCMLLDAAADSKGYAGIERVGERRQLSFRIGGEIVVIYTLLVENYRDLILTLK